jgi:triosephosphate isomerase
MLRSLGVRFVIVGHSERRAMFGDDDAAVARKAVAVLDAGMLPIVAVGESLEQRESGSTEKVITGQLDAALRGIAPERAATVVAYERSGRSAPTQPRIPIWRSGRRNCAPPFLRQAATRSPECVRILYGGSVNPGNIAAFMAARRRRWHWSAGRRSTRPVRRHRAVLV